MIYRFIILSDEVEDFRRDILIDSDAEFLKFHEAILDSVGYTNDHITSFFTCDDDWNKELEITLVEMDDTPEEDFYTMDATLLSDILDEERQKLIYMFDYLAERCFYIELREIITGKSQRKPECVRKDGEPPIQIQDVNESLPLGSYNPSFRDSIFDDDDDLDSDDYDDEDLDNLSEDDSFDKY